MLEVVLPHAEGAWPELEEWRRLLPAWFVAACSDDVAVQSCALDKWSLRAWIFWFQPDRRHWRWWAGRIEADDRLRVELLVESRPYLRGALEWLLKASGALAAA